MNDLVVIGFAVLITLIAYLIGTVLALREKAKECDQHLDTIHYLEDRIAYRDREGERNFKDLVGGIDGVTSVSLSAKRYVELLRAEESLLELKVKVRGIDNGK